MLISPSTSHYTKIPRHRFYTAFNINRCPERLFLTTTFPRPIPTGFRTFPPSPFDRRFSLFFFLLFPVFFSPLPCSRYFLPRCICDGIFDIAGHYVLAWKKGIAVLSAGNVKVSPDPRINLVNGYSLEIKEVGPQDAGDYVCQIGTLEPREITHTVEIHGK